jgi:hypothetical protein
MDIPDFAHAIEDALLGYERNCRGLDEDAVLRNTKYSAFFMVEMAKRWAERKYDYKRLNREVTIEETVEKSLKATDKYFQRQERKRAPEALRETNADAEELFAYLEVKPKVEDEPEKKDDAPSEDTKPEEAQEKVPEKSEESVPSNFGGAAAVHEDHEAYPVISPEEFVKIRR